jgi:hypothetical protein
MRPTGPRSSGYSTLLLRDHFVAEPFGDQLAPLIT